MHSGARQGRWSDIDARINQQISGRIRRELVSWERRNRFFAVQRPRLIELFERRFRGIRTHLSTVEAMISRHDSQLGPLDGSPTASSSSTTDESSQAPVRGLAGTSSLPFGGTQLHWTRKLVLGLSYTRRGSWHSDSQRRCSYRLPWPPRCSVCPSSVVSRLVVTLPSVGRSCAPASTALIGYATCRHEPLKPSGRSSSPRRRSPTSCPANCDRRYDV